LEKATSRNFHKLRIWLDEHRFYLNERQCERANRHLTASKLNRKRSVKSCFQTERFGVDPDMSDDYFLIRAHALGYQRIRFASVVPGELLLQFV